MQEDVQSFYNGYAEKEWARFESPLGILEFLLRVNILSKNI